MCKLLKLIQCSILFCMLTAEAAADWINHLRPGNGFVNAVAAAADGNGYATGYFSGAFNVGGRNLDGQGGGDVFLLSYDRDGQVRWAVQSIGVGWNGGRAVTVDDDGNVYLAGRFQGTARFEGQQITAVGENDVFVAKYASDGSLLWVRAAGSAGEDWGQGIAVAADGDVLVAGYFSQTISFGTQALKSSGEQDVFTVCYSGGGDVKWARGGGGSGNDQGFDVAVDPAGNATVAGFFNSSASFGGTQLNGGGGSDAFAVQYDSDGSLNWAVQIIGSGNNLAESVDTDAEGRVYLAGSFQANADIGEQTLQSRGESDVFVLQFNSAGELQEASTLGGSGNDGVAGFGQSVSIAAGADGWYWLTASFEATVDFGGTTRQSQGDVDIFAAQFDSEGALAAVETCGGSGFDNFVAIASDKEGNAFLTGNFQSPQFFCAEQSLTFGGSAFLNNFIAHFDSRLPDEEVPRIETDAQIVEFGELRLGDKSEAGFEVYAANAAGLRIDAVEFRSADAAERGFSILSPLPSALPLELGEAERAEIRLAFEPTSIGAANAVIGIMTNDPLRQWLEIDVSGSGTEAEQPVAVISVAAIEFGEVELGSSSEETFTISPGNAAGLRIDALEFSNQDAGDQGFSILQPQASELPVALTESESLEVKIAFAPAAVGVVQTGLNIQSNENSQPLKSLPLSGEGTTIISGLTSQAEPAGFELTLAPNPSPSQLTLHLTLPTPLLLTVLAHDLGGREFVLHQPRRMPAGEQQLVLSTTALPAGSYLLQLKAGATTLVRHLIVGER